MSRKSKINPAVKIKAVKEHLEKGKNISQSSKECGVDADTFRSWLSLYKIRGEVGLMNPASNRKYSQELKNEAVNDYLSIKGSLRTICEKYDISGQSMLRKWIKQYNGHKKFKQPNTGGCVYMTQGRKTTHEERIEIVSHCIANNKDYGKSIEKYGISYQQIYSWVSKYEKSGVEGLVDRRGKSKEISSMNEVDKLKAEIKLRYNEQGDVIILKAETHIFDLQESGDISLSDDLIEEISLPKNTQFSAVYDEATDTIILKPLTLETNYIFG